MNTRNGPLRPTTVGQPPTTTYRWRTCTAPSKCHIIRLASGSSGGSFVGPSVKQLAKLAYSRFVLLHVAPGWAARTYGPDAVSPEIAEDTEYLEKVRREFQSSGIPAEAELAYGEPRPNHQMG
jgi:hypothetical protein